MATDCEQEALELRGDLRDRLLSITEGAAEDADPARRRHAAEYLLERRLRNMVWVSDDRYLDRSPITRAEYQLFIDEMRARGEFRQPDHWRKYQFAPGAGRQSIAGLRKSDAKEFCRWLTVRKPGLWEYSVPVREELQAFCGSGSAWQDLRFDEDREEFPVLSWEQISTQIEKDKGSSTVHAIERLNWLLLYVPLKSPLALARDLAFALDRDLDRVFDGTLVRDLDSARVLALDRDLARMIAAFVLNWLCVVEKRANGELPVVEGL